MSLFNFDFSNEITKQDIEQSVKDLAAYLKENGNPRTLPLGDRYRVGELGEVISITIPIKLRQMIPHMLEEGYLVEEHDGNFDLKTEYRDYHTVEELVESFSELGNEYLDNGGDAYGLYSLRTTFTLHYRLQNHAEDMKLSQAIESELSRMQRSLGLEHFLNVEKSRGHRMNLFNDKESRKIKRIMAEELLDYNDYQSVKQYFELHGACHGVFEYNKKAPWIDHSKVCYLDLRFLLPTDFKCQCIAEATDVKDIMLIIDYMGGTNKPKNSKETIIIDSKGNRKRYLLDRDLKKTFDQLFDLDECSSDENEVEGLFCNFDDSLLDDLCLEGVI